MTRAHDELQSLLGAYALDAVDPEEAAELERHVAQCPRCRAELSHHLAAAPLLGGAGGEAPAGVWEKVVETISQPATTDVRRSVLRATRRSPRRTQAWFVTIAVGAAAAVTALALWGSVLSGRVDRLQNQSPAGDLRQAAASALGSPGHRTIEMRAASGRRLADVVVTTGGSAYLLSTSLPDLPTGRTYQLWALSDGAPVSLGVLGREPNVAAFRVERGMSELMITAEPSGGVAHPDSAVLAQGPLPVS